MFVGVALVHAYEFTCEEGCFFPAGAGFDFHDDVVTVVGVAGGEEVGEFFFEFHYFAGEAVGFGGEFGVFVGHFFGVGKVGAGLFQGSVHLHDGLQFRIPFR